MRKSALDIVLIYAIGSAARIDQLLIAIHIRLHVGTKTFEGYQINGAGKDSLQIQTHLNEVQADRFAMVQFDKNVHIAVLDS